MHSPFTSLRRSSCMSSKAASITGHSCNSTNAGASSARGSHSDPCPPTWPQPRRRAHGRPGLRPWGGGLSGTSTPPANSAAQSTPLQCPVNLGPFVPIWFPRAHVFHEKEMKRSFLRSRIHSARHCRAPSACQTQSRGQQGG